MNMSTNIALKTRTRCYSFDQCLRKCNDSVVVNMMAKKSLYFRTEGYLLCYCCCCETSSPPKQQEQGLPAARCQDSRTPTRSYTAAAAAVAVRCCCCCGLGTRTHTRTVPLTSGWRVYIPRRGTHQQAAQQAGPDIYRLAVTAQTLRNTTSYILLQQVFTATWAALYGVGCLSVRVSKAVSMRLARATSRHACFMSRHAARS